MNPCPKCGLNMDIYGRVHNCNPPKISTKILQGAKPDRIVIDDPGYDPKDKPFELPDRLKDGPSVVIMAKLHKNDCPVCEARRKLKALQMKRYRSKLKPKVTGGG